MNGLNLLTQGSGLSLVRILGTLSRTLGVVRQFSPLYKDIKPLLSKAPIFFERLANIRNTAMNFKNYNSQLPLQSIQNDMNSNQNLISNHGPNFFQ